MLFTTKPENKIVTIWEMGLAREVSSFAKKISTSIIWSDLDTVENLMEISFDGSEYIEQLSKSCPFLT